MTTLRVAALQMPHGQSLDESLQTAQQMVKEARAAGAELVVLPEYFFAAMAEDAPPVNTEALRDWFRAQSEGIALAGNVVERLGSELRNIGVVYEGGEPVLEQVKLHPMAREVQEGIVGGATLAVGDVAGIPTGILVCADVLYPEVSQMLAVRGAQVLLNPVLSAYRRPDPDREARKALYIARAYDAGAFVIKAGGYLDGRIAGRSLIAAPWGLLASAASEFEAQILMAQLDLGALATFRQGQERFPKRRSDLYGDLAG